MLIKPDLVTETIWRGTPLKFELFRADSFADIGPVNQVYGLVINDAGEVLLVAHADEIWSLPGGHTENSETPMETLVRECYEEAAVKVNPEHCIPFFYQKAYIKERGVWQFQEIQARYVAFHPVHDKFIADPDSENPMVLQKYIPLSKLRAHLHWGNTLDFIYDNLPEIYAAGHIPFPKI